MKHLTDLIQRWRDTARTIDTCTCGESDLVQRDMLCYCAAELERTIEADRNHYDKLVKALGDLAESFKCHHEDYDIHEGYLAAIAVLAAAKVTP